MGIKKKTFFFFLCQPTQKIVLKSKYYDTIRMYIIGGKNENKRKY